jgi:predicted nuclease with TOPRIM domain
MNGTFHSLSSTIQGLIQQVDKLPEIGQINDKLTILESHLTAVMDKHRETSVDLKHVEEAKQLFTEQISDLGCKMDKLNSISAFMQEYCLGSMDKEKMAAALEKVKLKFQEVCVTQENETKRSKIKLYGELGLKFLGFLALVLTTAFTAWKLFIEKVPPIDTTRQTRTTQSTPFIKR